MALPKQPVGINFAKGLDTKTDSWQVAVGNFLSLRNSVFDKLGRLTKRNGFGSITALPNTDATFLTTYNGNLTTVGTTVQAYNNANDSWVTKGTIQPAEMSVLPLIRNSTNQSQADICVAPSGLVCTVYTDLIPSGGSAVASYKYVVSDAVTGQNIKAPTTIPGSNVTGPARVFLLGGNFIIVFTNASTVLQYVAVNSVDPSIVSAATNIAASYVPSTTLSFDGVVAANNLYIAYNTTSGGQSVQVLRITSALAISSPVTFAGKKATLMSVTADFYTQSNPTIWVSFYDSVSTNGFSLALDLNLTTVLAPTAVTTGGAAVNLTSVAYNGVLTLYYENPITVSALGGIASNLVFWNTVTVGGTATYVSQVRSIGLASKAFLINNSPYFVGTYASPYQNTYFIFNSVGGVVGKLAYQNGAGYLTTGLPNVTVTGTTAQFPYLIKDSIAAVNKNTAVPVGTQVAGIYSQTGINMATFKVGTSAIASSEIGGNLNLSGGIVWAYDGYLPVEQGFHLYPDSVTTSTSTSGGSINASASPYYYQVTYEWADNQGNVFRSAPSIPVKQATTGTTSTNTINVPTLRLTYKTANPVKIVVYRWSTTQPVYYQVTSLTVPTLNNTTVDYVTVTDTLSDAQILGNNILYTNGGVLENIAPPAAKSIFLFDNRLWLIPCEDPNLLWYSKQVIENTPVEMSDLLTTYVAPTTSVQGSSGDLQCGAPMDDKAILFKRDAIYYISGIGPDNTGANNGYTQPTFITATVGCSNKASIVFIPNGIMFQSDKGIWLLARDLSTKYIGAPVEAYNNDPVVSAVSVPGTNQVRFNLASGTTLMYDYFVDQWGEFTGVAANSSTLFQNLHTYLDQYGRVFQETEGVYLDGSRPVLMSFQTSWLNLLGLQGFQRAYYFYLLGEYKTPHKLSLDIAFDYNPNPIQNTLVSPVNFNGTYGSDPIYGNGDPYGGESSVEQWRIFLDRQKCQSFQITLNELYDSTLGVGAGAGLTLSGLNLIIGAKKGYSTIAPSLSA